MKKINVNIKGLHCRSCEMVLEESLSQVSGVKNIKINHKTGLAEIYYEQKQPILTELEKKIKKAGYSLGLEDEKNLISNNPADYIELVFIGAILFFIYALIKYFGLFEFEFSGNSTPGLVGVFVVGLTAGVSSCMALVGGLVLGVSARHAELHPEATPGQKFKPHLFFNLGRLISYAVLGGLIGLLGSAFKLSSPVLGALTVIIGLVMLLLGLKLIEIFPKLSNKNISLPKSVSKYFGLKSDKKEYSNRGAMITGALTFFIPCGFTQAMQLYAVSTGSFNQGLLIMLAFALGTLPGLIGIGGLTSIIKGSFSRYFFKFAGLVVIILAIFNISTGYNLTGFSLDFLKDFSSVSTISTTKDRVELSKDGSQIVEMVQSGNGYSPNQFTIKKGVPVIWKINSTNQYTCAAYISMPAVNISQPLKAGENIIEFTATKTGRMRFTCSMGMYSGVFNVVE